MDLFKSFEYHAPNEDQIKRYKKLREKSKELAALVLVLCPNSEEKKVALERIKEANMWANASIAINEAM